MASSEREAGLESTKKEPELLSSKKSDQPTIKQDLADEKNEKKRAKLEKKKRKKAMKLAKKRAKDRRRRPEDFKDDVVPRKIPLNEKEQRIADGLKVASGDYPTLDNIKSDWDGDD